MILVAAAVAGDIHGAFQMPTAPLACAHLSPREPQGDWSMRSDWSLLFKAERVRGIRDGEPLMVCIPGAGATVVVNDDGKQPAVWVMTAGIPQPVELPGSLSPFALAMMTWAGPGRLRVPLGTDVLTWVVIDTMKAAVERP
jgi:hypothetical protein